MSKTYYIRLIPLRAKEFLLPVGMIEGAKGVWAERITVLVIEECLQEDAGEDPGESWVVDGKIPILQAIWHHFIRDTLGPEEVIFPRPCRCLDDPRKRDENRKREDPIPEMPAEVIPVKGGNIIAGDKEWFVPPRNSPGGQSPSEQRGKMNASIHGTFAALTTLSLAPLKCYL